MKIRIVVTALLLASVARAQFNIPLRIQDDGTNLTFRPRLNFIGGGTSCVDNSTDARTDCTVAAGAGGTLQIAYDNSAGAAPSILLTSANNEIQIRAPASAMGTIFDVQTSAGGGILRITDDGTSSFVSIGALTLTGAAASTWSTSSGALTVDADAALSLGTSTADSVTIGGTNIGTTTGNLTVSRGGGNVSTFQLNDSGGGADLFLESSAGGSAQVIFLSAAGALDTSLFRAGVAIVQAGTGGASGAGTLRAGTVDAPAATALTITGNAASTWSTSSGALTLTSAGSATWSTSGAATTLTVDSNGAALNLGTTNATAIAMGSGTIITQVIGRSVINAQNAGAGANTNQIVVSSHNSATANQAEEHGLQAFVAATSATVTFAPAFNAAPVCVCGSQSAAPVAVQCSASTTTLTMTTAASNSDTFAFHCIGAR